MIARLDEEDLRLVDSIIVTNENNSYLVHNNQKLTEYKDIRKAIRSRFAVLKISKNPSDQIMEDLMSIFSHDNTLFAHYTLTASIEGAPGDLLELVTPEGKVITESWEMFNYLEGMRDKYSKNLQDPSLLKKVGNIKKAATKAFQLWKKERGIKLSDDEQELIDRRKMCETCPFKKKGTLGHYCSKCGCYIKPKTAIKSESCPIGKW